MDSVTQLALGSALGVAVMGRRIAPWKAALWGGLAGTLPDLDVFIDYGDPVRNMTFHRSWSHSLFYLTLFSPVLAGLVAWLHGERALFRRWWLALWLALFTHPLLDNFTVYGTQLLYPFTDRPFAIGSVFIIDPLYTLPLLVGVMAALILRSAGGLRGNAVGIGISTAYLAWTVAAQLWVWNTVRDWPTVRDQPAERVLVTPTPLNSLLWRVVVIEENGTYHEGFCSVLDADDTIQLDRFASDRRLEANLRNNWAVARLAWFTRGFYKIQDAGSEIVLSDLRMGQEPNYVFSFGVARRAADGSLEEIRPEQKSVERAVSPTLRWTWERMWGAVSPPPR